MLAIALFEVRTKLKRLSTYVYFVVFAALAGLWMAAAGGMFASANVAFGSDKVFINAPYALGQTITVLGVFGMVTVAAFMGRAVQQDFEYQAYHFFFTSPITKRQYLLGRYLGTVVVVMVIFLGIAVGAAIGASLPGIDPARVGPWSLAAFVQPYALFLLPNVIVLGACFFALAALTRRMLPVYVAGVVVLLGYILALQLLRDIENRTVSALLDPMGSVAQGLVTRYWSTAEKNSQLVPLAAEVLWNRLLWLAVGLVVFGFAYVRFRMSFDTTGERRRKRAAVAAAPRVAPIARPLPPARIDVRAAAYLRQLPGLVALHLRETVKSVYFAAIVAAGALFILMNARVIGTIYGTNTYPVTYQVIDIASGSFSLFMLVITTLYAGELVWRERDARVALIADSAPAPTWLAFFSKLLALFATQALLQAVVMVCGILIQLFSGYTKLELGQYVERLFVLQLPDYWIVAALAFTIHVAVDHKYLAHFLVVLYYVAMTALSGVGLDDRLYHYGQSVNVPYSDMNGYGHFLAPRHWMQLYWTAGAVLLLACARLLWVRGTDSGWRVRLRIARQRFTAPLVATFAVALAGFVATGSWIFYNTHVLSTYRTEFELEELQAQYERRYKALAAVAQPKVIAAKVFADIHPHEHRVVFKGTFTLKNKADTAIAELYLNILESAAMAQVQASIPLVLAEERRELGWRRYTLGHALAPGETMTLDFELAYPRPGFTNNGAHRLVVDNGTFVNSSLLPAIGYQERLELVNERIRRKHGLGPRPRMRDIDDAVGHQHNYITWDADWIDFEATIATDPDQVALAPGYLQREWTENGRRFFRYRMDAPILDFYSFLSARYAVKKDAWHGGGGDVPIEIYYQPGHEYNLDAMIAGVKDALDYYTRAFSPYQHRQLRILEFPRYQTFAQSFPNTIPYSEGIGFIARVRPNDPRDLDYPYYVTAHEVAHQWWAHQVIGADVQGATMMSETLSQYSALMVMKKKYGDAKMKRFLRYELDAYLVGRATEREKELPLYRNESQPYIHYRKGSVAMYALQDAIGEEAVNRALAAYVRKFAFKGPPYTVSRDLLAELRAVTPPESQPLIADLFETITLWENRAISATSRDLGGGRYEVTLKVSARKLRADDLGRQTEVPMDDLVDIGVFGAKEAPLYLAKHRVRSGESTITVQVTGRPEKAGIDPVSKLIDRQPGDNLVDVTS
jgi:ABC-2 type transport system permease protein